MTTATETCVLAEMRTVTLSDGSQAETVRTIVRTYLSNRRAEQDLELMTMLQPNIAYRVFTVEHIDD